MQTKIYYMTRESFPTYYIPITFGHDLNINKEFIDKNYVCVHTMPYIINSEPFKYLEELFAQFNSDQNPLYEKRNLPHTSMSVGDIILYGKKYYLVTGFGFKYLFDL